MAVDLMIKPGVYPDISNDDYHSGPGISNSGLNLLRKSPKHYWAAYLDPDREEREATPALRLGSAIHSAILEPHKFTNEFVAAPEVDRRTKEGKDIYAAFLAKAEGRTVITAKEMETVGRVARSVMTHKVYRKVFEREMGKAETSIYWEDKDSGVLCRIRPDWLGAGVILDVKTTEDASPDAFMRSIFTYGYHRQAAFYIDGCRQSGIDPGAFMFMALEKSSPYAVAFYYAEPEMIEQGRKEYKKLLRIYADCLATGNWPGYPEKIVPINLPEWYLAQQMKKD
jgi:exodeoxyribonuclease VIII